MEIPGYDDLELMAHGGFALVYRAVQEATGLPVAVKLLGRQEPIEEERFGRELESLQRLSTHPNVVTILDWGRAPSNAPFMVLEFVGGGSLRDLLDDGPISTGDAVWIGERLLQALAAAHDEGILHRDVKPSNILLGRGEALLADFGLARTAGGTATSLSSLAATVGYVAPEALAGERFTPQADLFSVGATLYSLLTGGSLREGWAGAVAAAGGGDRPDLTLIPEELRSWIETMLDPDPTQRPRSADEARELLLEASVAPTLSQRVRLCVDAPAPEPVGARPSGLLGDTAFDDGVTEHRPRVGGAPGGPTPRLASFPEPRWWQRPAMVGGLAIFLLLVTAGSALAFLRSPDDGAGPNTTTTSPGDEGAESSTTTEPTSTTKPTTIVPPDEDDEDTGGSDDEERGDRGPTTVRTPNVVGLAQADAATSIERAGLAVDVAVEQHAEVAEGMVIRQSIAGDTAVEPGSVVTLVVSSGPPVVTVPDVLGLSKDEALARLGDLDLAATTDARPDRDHAADVVIEQSVPPGREIAQGSPIVIVVSSGPPKVVVPDVRNLPLQRAIAALAEVGLGSTVERQQTRDMDHEQVIEQSARPGDEVTEGSDIGLVVAQWPACRRRTVRFEREQFEFVPDHRRGDRDFDGNGPAVTFDFTLDVRSDSVVAVATMVAAELWQNNSDSTLAEGTQRTVLIDVDTGERIIGIDVPTSAIIEYVDDDHELDFFDGRGPLADVQMIGDARGDDAGIKTRVYYRVKTFSATLEETGLCLPS